MAAQVHCKVLEASLQLWEWRANKGKVSSRKGNNLWPAVRSAPVPDAAPFLHIRLLRGLLGFREWQRRPVHRNIDDCRVLYQFVDWRRFFPPGSIAAARVDPTADRESIGFRFQLRAAIVIETKRKTSVPSLNSAPELWRGAALDCMFRVGPPSKATSKRRLRLISPITESSNANSFNFVTAASSLQSRGEKPKSQRSAGARPLVSSKDNGLLFHLDIRLDGTVGECRAVANEIGRGSVSMNFDQAGKLTLMLFTDLLKKAIFTETDA